jgi:hypothetical protein|eukprot:COSAG06_NODE_6817_length_2763_cov_228.529279_2_plen_94_part_00
MNPVIWLLEDLLDFIGFHPHRDLGIHWQDLLLGFLIFLPFIWCGVRLIQGMMATNEVIKKHDRNIDKNMEKLQRIQKELEAANEEEEEQKKDL